MKTYEQWSSRGKQLGWSSDKYSQAAYQGYVNNIKQQQSKPSGSSNSSPAPTQMGPPVVDNYNDMQNQIKQLTDAIESQNQQMQANIASQNAKKPSDASGALAPTVLTGAQGLNEEQKKKKYFLQGGN